MKKFLFIITLSFVLFSCKKDDDNSNVNFSTGIFKSNDWQTVGCMRYSDPSMSSFNKCSTLPKSVNQLEITKNSNGNYLISGCGFNGNQVMTFSGNNFVVEYSPIGTGDVIKADGSFNGNTIKINSTITGTVTGAVQTTTGTGTFTK